MRKRKSCRSHGERIINETLLSLNVNFTREVQFLHCRSPKGRCLRFDFFLPDYNLLIEYQGQHHYEPINKYARAKRVHETTILHDKIKADFAVINNYTLYCIPYWEKKNITDIIRNILCQVSQNPLKPN